MYLTRIALDIRQRETIRALSAVNLLHGAIEFAFQDKSRHLWRIDELDGVTWLMILSETIPKLSGLQAQFGYSERPAETRSCDMLFQRIVNGSRWRFRLVANPTRSVPSKTPGQRGKVVAEGAVPAQREWLQRHAASHGFSLKPGEFDITRSEWKQFRKGTDRYRRVTLLQVTYEGLLEVTDAVRFLETLKQGLGRGKAYGLGMITVMRYE